jgi:histone-lysine N-methyltransferase SUV420H
MLALPSLKRFSDNLKSAKEKDSFRQHMRRYLSLYLPDCPFEISGTNRYTRTTHEAMIVARKPIRKGEEIKYLCGIRVILTDEQEKELTRKGLDFSIVETTRNSATSGLFGPTRFSNHDCGANAKLITTGSRGMKIIATRDIGIGEEITVPYAGTFFGKDNYDCLCKTCEGLGRNGWTSEDQLISNRSPKSSLETDTGESLDDISATQPVSSGRSTSKRASRPSRSLRSDLPEKFAETDSDAEAPYRPVVRVPGDYESVAWAHFGRCLGAERADGVSTHSCSICERHRELYGYRWPKTKNGRYDNEERTYSPVP